jgi:hypothetical protein
MALVSMFKHCAESTGKRRAATKGCHLLDQREASPDLWPLSFSGFFLRLKRTSPKKGGKQNTTQNQRHSKDQWMHKSGLAAGVLQFPNTDCYITLNRHNTGCYADRITVKTRRKGKRQPGYAGALFAAITCTITKACIEYGSRPVLR